MGVQTCILQGELKSLHFCWGMTCGRSDQEVQFEHWTGTSHKDMLKISVQYKWQQFGVQFVEYELF